jgi:GMP synthase-like glutamine amidotransferase
VTTRVGLLVCDHFGSRFRAIAGDYLDMFAAIFGRHAPDVELVPFDVVAGVFPEIDDCVGYLCTGSRRSAYDEGVPWIDQLAEFIRQAHTAAVPFVGSCFGHQMLAQALGGRVTPAPTGWGVGAHTIHVQGSEPWMVPRRNGCRLLFMHGDQVVELPPGATLLGSTDHCPLAMFRVGPTSLGLQAHPEFTAGFAEALVREQTELIGEERARQALASLGPPTDEASATAWMSRFLAGAGRPRPQRARP